MLRQPLAATTRRGLRHALHTASPHVSSRKSLAVGGATALALATALVGAHLSTGTVHNDAAPHTPPAPTVVSKGAVADDGTLHSHAWGSNQGHVIKPDAPEANQLRAPAVVAFLEDVALRDLVLHARHAACVDARGDVYQWGDGFFGENYEGARRPVQTLRGKNITSLQVTESRVFALSASGRVYVVSSDASKQIPSNNARPIAASPWWSTGWLWSESGNVDFVELEPAQVLAWNEKITSIAAGRDHLLALTSAGRTFAHPITKRANSHGQLGFRKFDVPGPSSTRLHAELTPLAVADPYARLSRAARAPPSSSSSSSLLKSTGLDPVSETLRDADDATIRFSDRLFEIPALREVHVHGIAAGARSSYVRTDAGRVLGWGANEYGQLGLGSTAGIDTVTIPTEVVLWRGTPQGSTTRCLDVRAGGELAFFVVERRDGTSLRSVDLLACGNGQYGGLGNAMFVNAQGVPVRTRGVSGLLEYSDKTRSLEPILPRDVSISPDGHVLLALDTRAQAGPGGGGMDVFAWGTNYDYQLGNGRRTSLAVPATLERDGARYMLMRTKAQRVQDMQGKEWGRGVEVEQAAVAGYGNSAVYWRLC